MKSLFLIACLIFSATSANAEIFKWVDENGKTHFSNQKPRHQQAEKLDVKINLQKKSSQKAPPKHTRDTRPLTQAKKVVMYSASWCGYCKQARNYFRDNHISFQEYDVETSDKGQRDYKQLKATGVPVILVGKKRMNGFSAEDFQRMYR